MVRREFLIMLEASEQGRLGLGSSGLRTHAPKPRLAALPVLVCLYRFESGANGSLAVSLHRSESRPPGITNANRRPRRHLFCQCQRAACHVFGSNEVHFLTLHRRIRVLAL
jgi:hypothetical protein